VRPTWKCLLWRW